jgi:hypothetical protein
MKAAEATMETMEKFMVSLVEIVDVDVLKDVWFEECVLSPRSYTLLRTKNTTSFCILR